jgi:hypothetical protein
MSWHLMENSLRIKRGYPLCKKISINKALRNPFLRGLISFDPISRQGYIESVL